MTIIIDIFVVRPGHEEHPGDLWRLRLLCIPLYLLALVVSNHSLRVGIWSRSTWGPDTTSCFVYPATFLTVHFGFHLGNTCARVCRQEVVVECLPQLFCTYLLRQGLSLNLEFTDFARLGDQQAQGILLSLLISGIIGMHDTWAFTWIIEMEPWFFYFHGKYLTKWSISHWILPFQLYLLFHADKVWWGTAWSILLHYVEFF